MFIVAFIATGGILTDIWLDIPGRYHRTVGICTVESGTSFDLFLMSLLYHNLFILFISSHFISSHFTSPHLISSHFIYLFISVSCILCANIITANELLILPGRHRYWYKPLWAVTVFAGDDVDMTNPLFFNASSIENDIRSYLLSEWYTLSFIILRKEKK